MSLVTLFQPVKKINSFCQMEIEFEIPTWIEIERVEGKII